MRRLRDHSFVSFWSDFTELDVPGDHEFAPDDVAREGGDAPDVDWMSDRLNALKDNMEHVIVGKPGAVEQTIVALVGGGHLLIEDVPGVAKTMLGRALATSMDAAFQRLQCTPDLMPSDVTGVSVFNKKTLEFEFRPGPIFTHVLLADEINRATPRTQSALLEAMAEGQVSVDDETHPLDDLFFVIATQNPVEHQGTYPLPEAQLDRFMLRISIGYPDQDEEVQIMQNQKTGHPIHDLEPVLSREQILEIRREVCELFVHPSILTYITDLVRATREAEHLEIGSSPRGSICLMRAAQVKSAMKGNAFVTPDAVQSLAPAVLAHRVMVKPESDVSGVDPVELIEDLTDDIAVPVAYSEEDKAP